MKPSTVIAVVFAFVLGIVVTVQTSGKLWYLGATGSTADINLLHERFEGIRSAAARDSAARVHALEEMELDLVIAIERGFDPAQARLDYLDRALSSDPGFRDSVRTAVTSFWPPAPAAAALGEGDLRVRRLADLQRRIRELLQAERNAALVLAQAGANGAERAIQSQGN